MALLFTQEGLKKLRERIAQLENAIQHLESQTSHVADVGGNQWHDNASYDALLIDIRGADFRLREAHKELNQAQIAPEPDGTKVAIGVTVRIDFSGDEEEWLVGGHGESDPDSNIIAYDTPLAMLILDKSQGEMVSGNIGGRKVEIRIIEIKK